ncbi:sterol acyltransferase KNAG_0I02600 [Huiozyma naganishii CBS 8797]|uniref:O-acyltransferase n=1 Tax=Huiozyma naganishii (strain ATCC MYA-139 / BCRC 22969 / CBS 8797 / KCTC 17520 / NBRC 10181 / NCYC 3082 / Yp74L-3) TaxID=1071383 RepID=J7RB00_HUIN7|nr:hypothetical protein KNAG_0I02600 [Kazachstania naganishii CBS 8797]CCK72045.1 hypothetical protein KNAG_0I02600 [Kazachstania naganishii CBS 8797]
MSEEKELLEDEEFLRIQRLNSLDNLERRRSIVYDKPVPDLPGEADAEEENEGSDRNSDASIASSEETSKSKDEVLTEEKKVEIEDEMLKRYLTSLHNIEKRRYKRDTNTAISFFSDVDFDQRPTLLDDAIATPLISTFEGPVLEKQIKAFEKVKREIKDDLKKAESLEGKDKVAIPRLEFDFTGLYIMMWMIFGWIAIRGMVDYYVFHDGDLKHIFIWNLMTEKWQIVWPLDAAMWATSFIVVPIQWLVKYNVISWNPLGRYLVVVLELFHVFFFNHLAHNVFCLNWISRIFFFLHSIVFIMKMHSFSFFNGYLWNIKREYEYSTKALAKCKDTASTQLTETLERSRNFCEYELTTQSTSVKFPDNISLRNYFLFTLFPTVVYQVEYPRTKRIRWWYVLEKMCAIFGIIFLMMMCAQLFVYPACMRATEMRQTTWPDLATSTKEFFYLLAELIPGMTILYLLTFYLIWDAILNFFSELTMFADRYFYGDWWNCVIWSEFSRIWNVPVHKFLLRHVYHSSMNHFKWGKLQATIFTFVLSAIFHELSMYVIYQRFRPYLFLFQLSQLPMTYMCSFPPLKGQHALLNILFIFGVCTGPSVITCLYIIY